MNIRKKLGLGLILNMFDEPFSVFLMFPLSGLHAAEKIWRQNYLTMLSHLPHPGTVSYPAIHYSNWRYLFTTIIVTAMFGVIILG